MVRLLGRRTGANRPGGSSSRNGQRKILDFLRQDMFFVLLCSLFVFLLLCVDPVVGSSNANSGNGVSRISSKHKVLSGMGNPITAARVGRSGRKMSNIYIAGFFPLSFNVTEGAVGRGVLPAVKLALHHINNNTYHHNVLPNYRLHIAYNNTQVWNPKFFLL